MSHGAVYPGRPSEPPDENKSRTSSSLGRYEGASVKKAGRYSRNAARDRCSFITAEDWRYGTPEPFCNAPSVPGTSYCERHLRACAAAAGSPEAARLALALEDAAEAAPPLPPELAFLAEGAVPEPIPEEPRDLLVLLDHGPPDRRTGDGE